MPIYSENLETPIGILSILATDQAVTAIQFHSTDYESVNPVTRLASDQLKHYFSGVLKQFTVPIQPLGTNFQHQVWDQLQMIPWGHTCSYGDIARAIGNSGASRAVGSANNKNPIPIIIPCHRIVGSKGELTGYAGGLGRKTTLLSLESSILNLDFGDDF